MQQYSFNFLYFRNKNGTSQRFASFTFYKFAISIFPQKLQNLYYVLGFLYRNMDGTDRYLSFNFIENIHRNVSAFPFISYLLQVRF